MNWKEFDYKSPSLIGVKDESHGGEDVPILAKGPWAHLFTGMQYSCLLGVQSFIALHSRKCVIKAHSIYRRRSSLNKGNDLAFDFMCL